MLSKTFLSCLMWQGPILVTLWRTLSLQLEKIRAYSSVIAHLQVHWKCRKHRHWPAPRMYLDTFLLCCSSAHLCTSAVSLYLLGFLFLYASVLHNCSHFVDAGFLYLKRFPKHKVVKLVSMLSLFAFFFSLVPSAFLSSCVSGFVRELGIKKKTQKVDSTHNQRNTVNFHIADFYLQPRARKCWDAL